MAEAITELIIPGTYIEVRAEGLIGVTGVATGNVGVVGTASRGPVDAPVILSSMADAREIFGEYDGWTGGTNDELTLVRAAQQLFSNGASTVYAVRTAGEGVAPATRAVGDATGTVVTFSGKTPGTWAHDVSVQVLAAGANAFVEERRQTVGAGALQPLHQQIADSPRNVVRVVKGSTGQTVRLPLATTGSAAAGKPVVRKNTGELLFHASDQPAEGDEIIASYEVDKASSREIEVKYGNATETYIAVDATDIERDINRISTLVEVEIQTGADARTPDAMAEALLLTGGSDGADADAADYTDSLAHLDAEPVNIVTLAGLTFSDASPALLAHVETAENNGRDRIAVVGADGDEVAGVQANSDEVSDDRFILVAPGVQATDLTLGEEVDLDASYAAAAVAGVIASLAVHVSPTNKALRGVGGLTTYYNDGELKKLLGNRVMVLERKAGFRIVKGITTDSGPFKQVSVRRIVDFAKAGTRIGSNPYIGRLNNARVRGALQATLNGFLSDMVLNEALTTFELSVTATRDQEIQGVCLVTMLLQPTFSIDYIKVIMNLS